MTRGPNHGPIGNGGEGGEISGKDMNHSWDGV